MRALERELARDIVGAFALLSENVDEDVLEEAIEYADYATIEREVGVGDDGALLVALIALIGPRLRTAFDRSANDEADALGWTYDALDASIASSLRNRARQAAVLIVSQARNTVRGLLTRGSLVGQSPEELALLLGTSAWMLDRHAAAVQARHRAMLEEGLSEEAIRKAMEKMAQRYLDYRAIMIAITETTAAITEAQFWVWQHAVRDGALDPNRAWTEWVRSDHEKVCTTNICPENHGTRKRLADIWIPGPPPVHPFCSCRLKLVIE